MNDHPPENVYKDAVSNSNELRSAGRFTLTGEKSLLSGIEPINPDGSINAVIEVPAGTNSKWEVSKPEGHLTWEFENEQPRIIDYLSYPGNYGMIPRTILPKEQGGDGDPLDVFLIGPSVPRGSVVRTKVIGVLRLIDCGEVDDKLIAVMENTRLYRINQLAELDLQYPDITSIIELWFLNYKGAGKMQSHGYDDVDVAMEILDTAIKAFRVIS
jgi:inorganic pyrophosphatase